MAKRKNKYPRIRNKSLAQGFSPERLMQELNSEKAVEQNGLIKRFTLARTVFDSAGIVSSMPNPQICSKNMRMLVIDYFTPNRYKIPFVGLSHLLEKAGDFEYLEVTPSIELSELESGASKVSMRLPGIESAARNDYRNFKLCSYAEGVDLPDMSPALEEGVIDLGVYRGPKIAKRAVESYRAALPEVFVLDTPKVISLD